MKEKDQKLLAKKIEMEANKGRSFEKPDETIKVVTTVAEEDNASDKLAKARFSLRPEVVEPGVYWSQVTIKWPEVHRSLPLEWSGRQHAVSSKTIELMHDMASLLKVFSKSEIEPMLIKI